MPGDEARALRNSLGLFATGVCVVTGLDAQGFPFGLTINSFSSVSLDPPLILWSLDKGSDTMPVFGAVHAFCVNVLGEGDKDLSQRLSQKGRHALHDGEWSAGTTGSPVLKAGIAHFDCEVSARHDGGDHVIIVGRVTGHAHKDGVHPLLYFRGRYRGIAPV